MADVDSRESPMCKPYRWEHAAGQDQTIKAGNYLSFAERVMRVAGGIQTAMEIVTEDGSAAECGYPHCLSPFARGSLLWLAQESAGMLSAEAEQVRDWFDDHHTKEGRLRRYQMARESLKQHGELPEGV